MIVKVNHRDINAGTMGLDWLKTGGSIRLEVGDCKAKAGLVTLYHRDQSKTESVCVFTVRPATIDAIFGRSY